MSRPVLSPDGHRIIARSVSDGKISLKLINADDPDGPVRSILLGKTTLTDVDWAGNKRVLLQIQSSQKMSDGEDIPFLRLLSIDVDTGISRVVDTKSRGIFAGDVLYTDPDGNWALVASQDDV